MTEWQDEPTEPGWYWVQGFCDKGPVMVDKGWFTKARWEAMVRDYGVVPIDGRKVIPIPEPEDA